MYLAGWVISLNELVFKAIIHYVIAHYIFICDWILENWPNCHIRPIGPANGYTCTLHINSAIIRLGSLACFSRVTFADPVNSWLRQWNPWKVLHGRHGSEIHPSDGEIVSPMPFKHVWTYSLHFWDPKLLQTVLTEGLTCLRLPTHLLHPPLPLPPVHPL